jgi:hypothetical protein
VWTENDDLEIQCGEWHNFNANDVLVEDRKIRPVQDEVDIWPNWHEGRPITFKRMCWSPSFFLNGIYHRDRHCIVSLEVGWNTSRMLSALPGNFHLLPGTYTCEWSGVYRIFCPNTAIDRCCGKDPTGTLYVGRAGSRGGNWSILRTRIAAAANRDHHATQNWAFSDVSRQKFPWGMLAVEWAYTGSRPDHKGGLVPEAILAERWLLSSYNDSFGEFPPWNQRGG